MAVNSASPRQDSGAGCKACTIVVGSSISLLQHKTVSKGQQQRGGPRAFYHNAAPPRRRFKVSFFSNPGGGGEGPMHFFRRHFHDPTKTFTIWPYQTISTYYYYTVMKTGKWPRLATTTACKV